jgi:hypothetical protein
MNASMPFSAPSASCGETSIASVRLPRQPQGFCQPLNQSPIRYASSTIDNHAMTINFSIKGQRPGVQALCIADVIESDAMRQLCVEQRNHVTPRAELPDFLLNAGFSGQFRAEKRRNQVAYLPQQIQFQWGWNAIVSNFHPCRVTGPNIAFQLFLKFLWDACECDYRSNFQFHYCFEAEFALPEITPNSRRRVSN